MRPTNIVKLAKSRLRAYGGLSIGSLISKGPETLTYLAMIEKRGTWKIKFKKVIIKPTLNSLLS